MIIRSCRYLRRIEINEIRIPVLMLLMTQQRSITCHFNNIAITLNIAKMYSLSKGRLNRS